ncbi:MAG: signal peptidase I [Limisphaerales bacterium]
MIQWFLSKTVRDATAMRSHVQKLLDHQRDILSPQALENIQAAITALRQAVAGRADKSELERQMRKLEETANKWLKPYPNPGYRENVEVLLVALAVAMGIRTFFLQPFKIPTGSMQPTLYGVTSTPDCSRCRDSTEAGRERASARFEVPGGWERVRQWFEGVSYLHVVAQNDGTLDEAAPPVRLLIFNLWQKLVVGGKTYILWFPPDYGQPRLEQRAGISLGQFFHKGDDIIKMRVSAGDHLFVDRVTYNFRAPERGEIIVFETKGIQGLPPDQFYIKRLCGLGSETLSLHQDYLVKGVPPDSDTLPVGNLVVDGRPITASTRHFENVYSFNGASARPGPKGQPGNQTLGYEENHYYGHALIRKLAPDDKFTVEPGHFFVMGDNTMNSLDSRFWGDFPASQAIGKSFFVYWPITERFGWGYQ